MPITTYRMFEDVTPMVSMFDCEHFGAVVNLGYDIDHGGWIPMGICSMCLSYFTLPFNWEIVY